jgi:hypothetical protein
MRKIEGSTKTKRCQLAEPVWIEIKKYKDGSKHGQMIAYWNQVQINFNNFIY